MEGVHLLASIASITKLVKHDYAIQGQKCIEDSVKYLGTRLSTASNINSFLNILHNGTRYTPCSVVEQLSLLKKKTARDRGFTHIFACRIFRWPYLKNSSILRSTKTCNYPYKKGASHFCVNPYHYEIFRGLPVEAVFVEPFKFPFKLPSPQNENLFAPSNYVVESQSEDMDLSSPPNVDSEELMEVETAAYHARNEETLQRKTAELKALNPDALLRMIACPDVEKWMRFTFYHRLTFCGQYALGGDYLLVRGDKIPDTVLQPCSLTSNMKRIMGEGLMVYWNGGEIYVESLRDDVFAHLPTHNRRMGINLQSVAQMKRGSTICIFKKAEFAQDLQLAATQGYDEVYALQRMYSMRLSFGKGWGLDYNSVSASSTYCWMEMHLEVPLTIIDRVLCEMSGQPEMVCSSFT